MSGTHNKWDYLAKSKVLGALNDGYITEEQADAILERYFAAKDDKSKALENLAVVPGNQVMITGLYSTTTH